MEEEYVEYMLTKPLWIKDHPEYNQFLGTTSGRTWDEEGQIERFEPNAFDKEDEYGEEFNWDKVMEKAHNLKREMVAVTPQELARILMKLPPMPPVIPITEEQMEQWFQPWDIITVLRNKDNG